MLLTKQTVRQGIRNKDSLKVWYGNCSCQCVGMCVCVGVLMCLCVCVWAGPARDNRKCCTSRTDWTCGTVWQGFCFWSTPEACLKTHYVGPKEQAHFDRKWKILLPTIPSYTYRTLNADSLTPHSTTVGDICLSKSPPYSCPRPAAITCKATRLCGCLCHRLCQVCYLSVCLFTRLLSTLSNSMVITGNSHHKIYSFVDFSQKIKKL